MPRTLPGTVNIIGREYIYVEHPGPEAFAKSFFQIGDGCDPLPTSGGMINEEAMIELPSGIQLHALSYKGDIGGWHRRVTEWCKTRGLLWGKIVESRIVLSNGVTLPLQQCRAEVR